MKMIIGIARKKDTQEIVLIDRFTREVIGGPYADITSAKRERNRRERNESMKDLGLTKVKGNLGGTYWE